MDLAGQRSNFNAGMRKDRAVDQLIGICSGIVADGEINPAEVAFLRVWLSEHQEACRVFPGDLISRRLEMILADGVVTPEERQDLLELLQQIAGHDFLTPAFCGSLRQLRCPDLKLGRRRKSPIADYVHHLGHHPITAVYLRLPAGEGGGLVGEDIGPA